MSRSPHKIGPKAYETLTHEKNNFKVEVSFAASRIHVVMQHQTTKEIFTLFITQENIDKNPTLSLVYSTVDSLFRDLRENFGQVNISDNGVMTISIHLQMMGRTNTKTVSFYPMEEESLDTADIEGHLSELASERNKYVSIYHAQHSNEMQALRTQNKIIKERMVLKMPNAHFISENPYEIQPPHNVPPQQEVPLPQQVSPPKHTQRRSPSIALPISQERIIKSPTIVQQKDSSQTNACKCLIM